MRNDLENYVEFNKERDLGSIIGDTITFLKYEWQPFFSTILKFSILPVLVMIAFSVYYTYYTLYVFGNMTEDDPFVAFGLLGSKPFLLLSASQFFAFAFITVSAYAYIKSYAENKGKVNFEDVKELMKAKVLPYTGLSILSGFVVLVGFFFLVIPGFYLAVILALSGALLIFENKGVIDAFGDSFKFGKNYWWDTFGVLFVVNLIIIVLNYIVEILIGMHDYTGDVQTFDSIESILQSIFSDPIYVSLLVASIVVGIFLNILTTVSTALIYFDIYEKTNPHRHDDIIDTLGSDS